MRARLISAGAVIAAALVGAAWLVSYRAWYPYNYIDYPGGRYRWTVPVKQHPWWSAYAALALILIGAAIADRLVPELRPLIRREARRLRRASVAQVQALMRRAVAR